MALHRRPSEPAERGAAPSGSEAEEDSDLQPIAARAARIANEAGREGTREDVFSLGEILQCHGLPPDLIERLAALAIAPPHAPRLVDRLAVALAAHFHFLPLEDALRAPLLLYGKPGAGASTLAAKLAARFEEHRILVIDTDPRNAGRAAPIAEYLDVLGLPLAIAADAGALRALTAKAEGRAVLIDTACGAPTEAEAAEYVRKLADAAGGQSMLVLSADTEIADAAAIARAAARIGTRGLFVTRLDIARSIGAALVAADAGDLAFVAASVAPHFGIGFRPLSPENLARRLVAAALRGERWRTAPF